MVPHGELLAIAMKLPDAMKLEREEIKKEWDAVMKTIGEAVEALIDYRKAEGLSLEKILRYRFKQLIHFIIKSQNMSKSVLRQLKTHFY